MQRQQAELQNQISAVSLDKGDLKQASQLQQQLQQALHEQQQLTQKLSLEWKEHNQALVFR